MFESAMDFSRLELEESDGKEIESLIDGKKKNFDNFRGNSEKFCCDYFLAQKEEEIGGLVLKKKKL